MLHPRFFIPPRDVIVTSGQRFEVLWYAQSSDWTLVHWRLWFEGLSPNGSNIESENLFKEKTLIDSDRLRGEIVLPGTQDYQTMAVKSPDPRARIDKSTGRHGMSAAIAGQLRHPKNRISLKTRSASDRAI